MLKRTISAVLMAVTGVASAATLSFSPTDQTIALGDTTSVEVRVSDLPDVIAIGAYQLRVLFTSTLLDATSITFSDRLGSAFLSDTTTPAGAAEASFVSGEFDGSVLLALQTVQPFTVFTINFTGVGVGTSPLSFAVNPRDLSDQDGNLLPSVDVIAQAGSITVTGDGPVIPEPSMFLPLLVSVGAVWFVRRKRA